MKETETLRFDQPINVWFGGQELVVEPLGGLRAIRDFESALVEEINSLDARVREHARANSRVSAEALLETGVDEARLLKLGLPAITDELLDKSTARERLGVLTAICYANNLARFASFLQMEALVEVASKMNQQLPDFPMPASNGNSSEPASVGETSSTN